ncbi:hypothetical protein ACHAXA_003451 [Cyclostephanos tholiformis]|uniref:2Fe-2S ferredoxin-type domain-containing protein n=1 Tax=Cyclostephanos tholiformis TaxID=382380 RepID=A0ABD3R2V8_9STRA
MTTYKFARATLAVALLRLIVLTLDAAHVAHSFVPSTSSSYIRIKGTTSSSTTTTLHIFGGLKDAFSNDDSLGKAKDAGLSSGPRYNDQVTVNGKPISKVVVDQRVSQVCNAARVKVPYNCQNGECGTCTVKMNGKKVRACVAKVPSGKCAIQTL